GAALIGDDESRRHDLAFELELHRSECEFLTGAVASAEKRLTMLSSRALSVAERAAVVCVQTDVYFALREPERALAEGAKCLDQGGLTIRQRPTEAEAQAAYDDVCSRLDGVAIDEIAALPVMTDSSSRAILDLLPRLATCAALADRPFDVLLICGAVALTLEHGVHDASCWAFTMLGYLA